MSNYQKAPFIYFLGKKVLSKPFLNYYKPTIIGEENIPTDGPIVVACDHIHLFDQCPIIVSTKRPLFYMAKREYFDHFYTRWFFKGAGCISVDRNGNTKSAIKNALEVLKHDGALGIFPEGTRNALKDERVYDIYDKYFKDMDKEDFKDKLNLGKPKLSQVKYLLKLYDDKRITKKQLNKLIFNADESLLHLLDTNKITRDEYYDSLLLPFKMGAVSFAKKSHAYIVPVGICGKYESDSKNLIIRFGKPFKVDTMDLPEANDLLRDEIKDLIKQNMEI